MKKGKGFGMLSLFTGVPMAARLAGALTMAAGLAFSQTLPTAKSIAAEMGAGWNLGNTMEATGGPTAWGNDVPSQALIDSVKAAGFKTIRIPAAWDGNADPATHVINAAWMAQVKQVVDLCVKDSLFVVLNIHWDGGWLENRIDSAVINPAIRDRIKAKQGAYWRQIATTFRNYDRHMIFASANEPAAKDSASVSMLNSFHQIFIDTVRATGGNNASRSLIIQGPSTNIEDTYKLMKVLPVDKIADRLMAEVHFYPYQFALMETDADWGKVFYYWGKNNHSATDPTRNPTWGEEAYTDSVFNLMKTQFTDKNIPVLLGEMGAVKRLSLTGEPLQRHVLSRRCFYEYVVSAAKARGIIPVVWDAGGQGNNTMSVFDRKTGGTYDLGLLNAIRSGMGLPKLPGDTSLPALATGANAMKILYTARDSMFGQVNLGVLKPDFSVYDSIAVRAYVNGSSSYDSAGTLKSGYLNLNLVTMSNNWVWKEASLGALSMDAWKVYTIPIAKDTTVKGALVPADPKKVDFFALQGYSKAFHGTIYIDYIAYKTKGGVSDTLYPFDQTAPGSGTGNVVSVKLIPVSDVAADQEWKTATQGPASLARRIASAGNTFRTKSFPGRIHADFWARASGSTQVVLQDLAGRTLWSRSFLATVGWNTFEIPTGGRNEVSILRIRQNGWGETHKIFSP
jgi:aryl-phospho-beta-D-glucosidase BglC (GH1 family)